MKILLLSDDIPGHVNQARGLINLFRKQNKNINCTEHIVKLKYKWMRPVLKKLLNSRNNLAIKLTCFAYQFKFSMLAEKYNLIVSAGGNTSYINAAISEKLALKNIFIGSLRNLDGKLFDANLTLEKTQQQNNVVMTISPCLTTLSSTISASQKRYNLDNSDSIWLMIIGGDGAGCSFNNSDWMTLAENMISLSKQHNIKWLLTTSRRTGLENEILLKSLLPLDVIEESIWYNHAPKKVMQAFLGRASKVFCTVDSMSMISEAISSCTETTALIPNTQSMSERYQNALSRLEQNKLLKITTIVDFKDDVEMSENINENQYLIQKMAENENEIHMRIKEKGIEL